MKTTLTALTVLLSLAVAPCYAGASGGPVHASTNLAAGKSSTWVIAYEADEPAAVFIQQNQTPSANISVTIRDAAGKRVAYAGGDGGILAAGWDPSANQNYTVEVKNLSKATAVIDLDSN
jgi:hypothetical protein